MPRHFGGVPAKKGPDQKTLLIIASVFFLAMLSVLMIVFIKKGSGTGAVIVENAANDINSVSVIVPVRKINKDERLTQDMFKMERRSRFDLSEGYVDDLASIDGYYAKTLIVADQPLYRDYMTKFAPLSQVEDLPEGFQAVTIPVDKKTGISGFAQPGSWVDVHWIKKINGKDTLTTIVERAKVLSKGTRPKSNPGGEVSIEDTVTLMVNVEDAKKITLAASSQGVISLTLRGSGDFTPSGPERMTEGGILGSTPKPQSTVIERPRCTGKIKIDGKSYCMGFDGSLIEADERGNPL